MFKVDIKNRGILFIVVSVFCFIFLIQNSWDYLQAIYKNFLTHVKRMQEKPNSLVMKHIFYMKRKKRRADIAQVS